MPRASHRGSILSGSDDLGAHQSYCSGVDYCDVCGIAARAKCKTCGRVVCGTHTYTPAPTFPTARANSAYRDACAALPEGQIWCSPCRQEVGDRAVAALPKAAGTTGARQQLPTKPLDRLTQIMRNREAYTDDQVVALMQDVGGIAQCIPHVWDGLSNRTTSDKEIPGAGLGMLIHDATTVTGDGYQVDVGLRNATYLARDGNVWRLTGSHASSFFRGSYKKLTWTLDGPVEYWAIKDKLRLRRW